MPTKSLENVTRSVGAMVAILEARANSTAKLASLTGTELAVAIPVEQIRYVAMTLRSFVDITTQAEVAVDAYRARAEAAEEALVLTVAMLQKMKEPT